MTIEDLIAAITALSAADRQRLFAQLDALRDPETSDSDTPPDRTAHDRARHLAGAAPGPADLSSNPVHLRGFGTRPARP